MSMPTASSMLTFWIFAANLLPFLTALGWTVGRDLDPDDWVAIEYGIKGTNNETDRWVTYKLAGQDRAVFSLASDSESDIVHIRVALPASLVPGVEAAAEIFAHFSVIDG